MWEGPHKFHLERFLDTGIDFRGLHFELIPFGASQRGCPDIAFAVAIEELAFAKLVHKFNFNLPHEGKPDDLNMSESNGMCPAKTSCARSVTLHYKHVFG